LASARIASRIAMLVTAYAAHPERFPRGVPRPQLPPKEVWINKATTTQLIEEAVR
jgi:putative transposase